MSGTEIVVILLLALVVLGPEKLPDAIRKFGKTYAELKKMGTGFQQEFKSAIDEPMREMRETADLLKKSADFSGSSAAPKVPSDTTAAPVTDDMTDRPTRNEGVAPADPDSVPTDDVPFAGDDSAAVDDVEANGDDTVAIEDVAATTGESVPAGDDDIDPVRVSEDPHDEPADRGEADDA
jgi:sec-independent protein translocase protein TatB